jgi:RimJ/RimL family protein N-acetyltransferase
MEIKGKTTRLRPAVPEDRRKIFEWLTQSDITPSVMGPPIYPEHPIPTWDNFCNDYTPSFFNASGDRKGRVFIIVAKDEDIGAIGYDLLDKEKDRVVLDIWMKEEQYCGCGYGSDALNTLSFYIHKQYNITNFVISPSARNQRAVEAYRKVGFDFVKALNKEEAEKEFGFSEYDDSVIMIKVL